MVKHRATFINCKVSNEATLISNTHSPIKSTQKSNTIMSTFTVNSIQATASYAVKLAADPPQIPAPVGQATEILNQPIKPFAFNLAVPPLANQAFAFSVTGRVAIANADLPLWSAAGARYRITSGTDSVHPLMQSDSMPVGNIPVNHTLNVAAVGFHLLQVPLSVLPFKFVGNWVWSVVLEVNNGHWSSYLE